MSYSLDAEGLVKGDPEAITTFTHRVVNPRDMQPEDVELIDIAHSLALQCRWNGHCHGHLSVARHSIWVMHAAPKQYKAEALLHDAAEAYLGDLVKPLKHSSFGEEYLKLETYVELAIALRFDLANPLPQMVVDADRMVTVELEAPSRRWTWQGNAHQDEREFLLWARELGLK